jgi:protein-tyrosine phosphatase
MRLLLVCTGNICRSAAAELLVSSWAAGSPGASLLVRSAGTRAVAGRPVHPWTAAALERRGVPTAGFSSSRLTGDDVDRADLVLTMAAHHRDELLALRPRALRRTFTLHEASRLAALRPPGVLDAAPPVDRPVRLADALAEARAVHRSAGGDADVADPIDGPARAHAVAVDEVAEALAPLLRLLESPATEWDTVRIHRLPPVPAPA